MRTLPRLSRFFALFTTLIITAGCPEPQSDPKYPGAVDTVGVPWSPNSSTHPQVEHPHAGRRVYYVYFTSDPRAPWVYVVDDPNAVWVHQRRYPQGATSVHAVRDPVGATPVMILDRDP